MEIPGLHGKAIGYFINSIRLMVAANKHPIPALITETNKLLTVVFGHGGLVEISM